MAEDIEYGPDRQVHYYDRHGRRITRATWAALAARAGYTELAYDTLTAAGNPVSVTTFWLGICARGAGTGPPMIFRTVAYRTHIEQEAWCWPTHAAALEGHRRVLAWLAGTASRPGPWTPPAGGGQA